MRVLVLVLVLAACGATPRPERGPGGAESNGIPPDAGAASADAPLPLAADPPALAARVAAMVDALATALAATADCAALAERARGVLAEHREVRDAAAEAVRRGRGRDLDAALEAHAAPIAAAIDRLRPTLSTCGADPAFAEAITPFDL